MGQISNRYKIIDYGRFNVNKKRIGAIFISVLIFGIILGQENEAIKKWEQRLRNFPIVKNKTELELKKTFPSDEGELLSSKRVTDPIIDDEAKKNQNHLSKREYGLSFIFPAVRTHKNKIYLLHSWPRLEILELDQYYNIEHVYYAVVKWNFHVIDFLIDRDQKQITIYCVPKGSYEHMKVHIFEEK